MKIDSYNRIEGFHDSNLLGIQLVNGKNCVLTFNRKEWHSPINLTLINVVELRASEFYSGNIVCTLWLWPLSSAVPQEYWNLLLAGVCTSENMEVYKRRIIEQHGSFNLFSISSSYGCSLAAICESLSQNPL